MSYENSNTVMIILRLNYMVILSDKKKKMQPRCVLFPIPQFLVFVYTLTAIRRTSRFLRPRMRRAERSLDAQRNHRGNARGRQAETRRSPVGVDVRSATPRGARDAEVLRPSSRATSQSPQLAVDLLGARQPAWLVSVAASLLFWRLVTGKY